MADLLSLSAVEARAALDAGEVSAPELTGAYLAAIEETGALNNYVAVTADKAMEMAEASQASLTGGAARLREVEQRVLHLAAEQGEVVVDALERVDHRLEQAPVHLSLIHI